MRESALGNRNAALAAAMSCVGLVLSFFVFCGGGGGGPEPDRPVINKPTDVVPAGYISIQPGFNAFIRETDIHADEHNRGSVHDDGDGVVRLVGPSDTTDLYFRCNIAANIKLGLSLRLFADYEVNVTVSKRNASDDGFAAIYSQNVEMKRGNATYQFVPIGEFNNDAPGYIRVSLKSVTQNVSAPPNIHYLCVSGASDNQLNYGRKINNPPPGMGQMRQGSNIHLNFTLEPTWGNIEYFYNELTVEEGFDPGSTFYVAAGSQGGYFGMQVNSRTERRMLFSIWSTFSTNNPNEIPSNYSVELIRAGDGTTPGNFGGEGSGRNCYINAMWKTGLTYKFLKRAQRVDANNTIYTAWWHNPETNIWNLMASYRQPHNLPNRNGWYSGPYSFIECFWDHYGQFTKGCYYGNQWARDTNGQWHEVTRAGYTQDSTQPYRKDYLQQVRGNRFYMSNGGFFNATTSVTSGTRSALGVPPNIDLSRADEYIVTNL